MDKTSVLLDTSPLVTLCIFKIANQPMIHTFLQYADVYITDAVQHEITVQYEKSDAQIAKRLVNSGQIQVISAPSNPTISDFYKLHETDCGVIRLGLISPLFLTVIDDKEAYVVSTRYGLKPIFLLDLLVLLVEKCRLQKQDALDMIKSAERRYSPAYIAHTIFKISEVIIE
jgi:predicted nucleic acid-binding protein